MVSKNSYKTKSPTFAELSVDWGNSGPIFYARHDIFLDVPSLETPLSIGIMSSTKIIVIFLSDIILEIKKNYLVYPPLHRRGAGGEV